MIVIFAFQCMKRLVLSCVGLEITRSFDSIFAFLAKTLLHVQREKLAVDVVALAAKAIQVSVEDGNLKMNMDMFNGG